ncbi:MAG: hypothetical protein R3A44_25405 [Caldilineaceae bacterium]
MITPWWCASWANTASTTSQQHWHIFLCQPIQPLPESWSHYTTDGGGHTFEFFWHDINSEPDDSWHPIFKIALSFYPRLF